MELGAFAPWDGGDVHQEAELCPEPEDDGLDASPVSDGKEEGGGLREEESWDKDMPFWMRVDSLVLRVAGF